MRAATLSHHPLQRRPAQHRRAALIVAIALALGPVLVGEAVKPLGEDITGGESIVAFELAGSVDRAEEILAKWRVQGVIDNAKAIQLFDLVYPPIYALALAGACLAAGGAWARWGHARLAAAGVAMAWLAFAAAGFDYVENLGLGVSLWGEPASPWPQIALVAALIKFAAIGVALLYALSGTVAALGARARRLRA